MVFQIRNIFSDFDRVILKTIDEFNSTEMQRWKTDANFVTKVASKKMHINSDFLGDSKF